MHHNGTNGRNQRPDLVRDSDSGRIFWNFALSAAIVSYLSACG
jgi:hypothetical protein